MKRILLFFVLFSALLSIIVACSKEPQISGIQATIDGYSVTFTAEVSNADTWLWDFGDNSTSTSEAPVHVYLGSGSFTVSLTVSGRGGEAKLTRQIEIAPSVSELLTGGPTATGGKTWVLSSGYTEGNDGASAVDNSMTVMLPAVDNMLVELGLEDEYDNEFTFYADGRYQMDVKNGIALTSGLYGALIGNIVDYGNESNNLSIYGGTFTPPANASWTLHEEDLVVDAINNPLGTEVPAPHENKTISGKKWVTLSDGAFFGVLDYPSTRKFIIKEITEERMYVAVFICGYYPDVNAWSIPAYLFHLTYISKQD